MRTELSLSDEWETPKELFEQLCEEYGIQPELDVAANFHNHKCNDFIVKDGWGGALRDGFDWDRDVWCNPPHSLTEKFVRKAYEQWKKNNITILMIIPANSLCTNYAFDCILKKGVEYYPILGRPRFLRNGKLSEHPSRNSYFVVIWRKRV